MKKIIKKICRFIGKILMFFDKILITPIMKVVLKITDFFKSGTKGFEKLLTMKSSLLIISLVIACVAFYVVDKDTNILVNNAAEKLYNQPVKALYNEEAYVIEGLPKVADVLLIGQKTNIFLAKQYPSDGVTVDLRELGVGTHKVELKYSQSFDFVEYSVDPSYVTVIIHDKVSAVREVGYEILHRENLDSKLDISDVTLSKTEVTIQGSEKSIASVAYVKALIDVNNLIDPEAGTTSVKGVKLVAYDDNGEIVDVEILQKSIEASVTLTSSSKTVPIKVIPTGNLALGYAINTLTPSSNTIVIYGSEENLTNIEFVPVYVDVTDLSAEKTFNVNVAKPSGVRDLSLKTLSIKLTITEEKQLEVNNVPVSSINLESGLNVQASAKEYQNITVLVKGSEKALANLDQSKVTATIDLSKYKSPGEYEVEVKVSGDNPNLVYSSKTTKVKIRIYKK